MAYAIKAEVVDPRARTFAFTAHKTMYGGKLIAIALMAFAISALSAGDCNPATPNSGSFRHCSPAA
jgi:hypothetical protein